MIDLYALHNRGVMNEYEAMSLKQCNVAEACDTLKEIPSLRQFAYNFIVIVEKY